MSKNKHQDLQPWLDYFKMLQRYEAKGFLEVKPQEHEAYVTRAALLTLSPTPALPEGEGDAANNLPLQGGQRGAALADTLRNIRAYAVWLETALPTPATETAAANSQLSTLNSQLNTPFAVHVVKEDYPHDLLLTLLLQQKRTWYGRVKDVIEVIDYTEQKTEEK